MRKKDTTIRIPITKQRTAHTIIHLVERHKGTIVAVTSGHVKVAIRQENKRHVINSLLHKGL